MIAENNDKTALDEDVSDMLREMREELQFSIDNNQEQRYEAVVRKALKDENFLSKAERALILGNDEVVDFYCFLHKCLQRDPVQGVENSEIHYMKQLSAWNRKRNMGFNARSIEIQDDELNTPKVSVVIPIHNTRMYLTSCIESLTAQTLESIEIICVDDGSTDGSGEILDDMEKKDTRIKVFHQKNQGISAARNAGMQHAHGEYVYFMDSDDLLREDALAKLTAVADKNKADVVYFSAESFFDDDYPQAARYEIKLPMKYSYAGIGTECVSGLKMYEAQNMNKSFYAPVWLKLNRTEFLRKNKLAFFEGIIHEDNLFTIEEMIKADRCCCIDEPFFKRRIRSDSIMTKPYSYRNLLGYYLVCVALCERIVSNQISQSVEESLNNWIAGIMKDYMAAYWDKVGRIDRILFLASLTQTERNRFYAFVMPTVLSLRQAGEKESIKTVSKKKSRSVKKCLAEHGLLFTVKKSIYYVWKKQRK